MKRYGLGMLGIGLLLASFYMGYLYAGIQSDSRIVKLQEKPVLGVEEKEKVFDSDSQIVFEQKYQRCGHVVVSDFAYREEIAGKTLEEIRKLFRPENGYSINMEDDTLLIHQLVDDWCPQDKEKCRLKEYRSRVAVYKGPDKDNDSLEKLTGIFMNSLPEDIQKAIRDGQYEFKDEESLNDALENLDEYQ